MIKRETRFNEQQSLFLRKRVLLICLLFAGFIGLQGVIAKQSKSPVKKGTGNQKVSRKPDQNRKPHSPPNKSEIIGGIEIGSSGVKAIAFQILYDSSGDGFEVTKIYDPQTKDTSIMPPGADGKFKKSALDDTVAVTKEFYGEMRARQIPDSKIYIAGSSGLRASNKKELENLVKGATGKDMLFLNAKDEVRNTIEGAIPAWVMDKGRPRNNWLMSVLIDIGSGNTKGGYLEKRLSEKIIYDDYIFEVPRASKTYADEIGKKMTGGNMNLETFSQKARSLTADSILSPLRDELTRKPGLLHRERVYLSGGIIYVMVTLLHPTDRRAYVPITIEDIKKFRRLVVEDQEKLLNPEVNWSAVKGQREREEIERDLIRVKGIFNDKQLIAGAEILDALSKELKFEKRRVRFMRHALYAWIMSHTAYQAFGEKKSSR